jgi:hypothetical protein
VCAQAHTRQRLAHFGALDGVQELIQLRRFPFDRGLGMGYADIQGRPSLRLVLMLNFHNIAARATLSAKGFHHE